MHTPLALYLVSLAGAVALFLAMPKQRGNLGKVGAVLAAAAIGALWLFLASLNEALAFPAGARPYYYIFSLLAIGAAGRVITHTRPVYAALWFVMVILASAGLFLTLAAEFMAFALIIIYAGAILVTYMFVIMLAQQSTGEQNDETSPIYDRFAREPLLAVAAGFLLLALLLNVTANPQQLQANAAAKAPTDQELSERVLGGRPTLAPGDEGPATVPAGSEQMAAAMSDSPKLANIERVGLDLFRSHPLGLELAGVILLVSLIGAVVIAKTRVAEEQPREGGPGTVDEDQHRFG
jgi:NADH-quinone oxidoreductase subunit J